MFIGDVIVLLAVATAGLLLGRAFRVPAIAAYLLGGVLAGPGGFGWVAQSDALEQLSEIGVALLLFGIGIEFSLDRLRRRIVPMVVTGALQVVLTIGVAAVLFEALGVARSSALFLGFLVSLSSTAIVFELYSESGELDAPQGEAAAGILLFQDLALVPMMLLVPVLVHPTEQTGMKAGLALARALVVVGALLFLTRAVLPRLLGLVARARTPELFPLAALVIAFGTALAAHRFGLSLPIGAFLAGLALSGSAYGHQVFAEVLPLRDAFVAVFFTSMGMFFQPSGLLDEPLLVATMLGVVLVKGALVGAVVHLVWRSARLGVAVGFALAQIGEFSFVLSREGVGTGLLSPAHEQAFLAAAVLSMAITPALLRLGRRLVAWEPEPSAAEAPLPPRDHVLILGHGTTGQAIARVLREASIPFLAVDFSAPVVELARREGLPIRFGDVSRRGVLERLGAAQARAAVVTVGEPAATRRAVALLRQLNPSFCVLVRAQRVSEIAELERLGATEVIPSEFETSIELFVRLLTHLGVPRHVARVQESLIRLDHYQALRGAGRSPELLAQAHRLIAGGILETAQVMERSAACGRTILELELRKRTGATVLSIVRDERPVQPVTGETRLEAGDLLVLFGPHETLDRALALFTPPTAIA